jgi:pimeloyl-ACP methyl ester carboxylesterase
MQTAPTLRPRRVALAAALALLGPGAASAGTFSPAKCEVPGVSGSARCGTFEVPENREARAGRRIRLNVVILPALEPPAAPDAITLLAGGPGEAVTGSAAFVASFLAPLRTKRDILLVDQRGTGGSAGLECDLYGDPARLQAWLGDFFPASVVRSCREALSPKADLGSYTTAAFADDLDELRAALGYRQLDILGGSYGTRAALVYMRRHAAHARVAVLQGSAPPDDFLPLELPRATQRAIEGIFAECAADAACRAAFPDPAGELKAVLERASREPAAAEVLNPSTSSRERVTLSRDVIAEAVRYMLYNPPSARQVPAFVHAAAQGDFVPLAEQALFARRNIVNSGGNGLYLTVTCAEDVPHIDPAKAAQAAAGTFVGDYRYRMQKAACAEWTRGPVPSDFAAPVRVPVPTLVISGAHDPATPLAWGEETARRLPRSLHLLVPHGAHDYRGLPGAETCVDGLIARFIEQGSEKGLDTSCVSRIEGLPFPLAVPDTKLITLPAEELQRFVGRYRSEQPPLEFELRVEAGRLVFTFAGRPPQTLAPVSPTRFRIVGAPLGVALEFRVEDGRVTGGALDEGSGPGLRFTRLAG